MKTTIQEVKTQRELRQFVHFPNALYKDNPYYVPTLERGDLAVLDPKKNHAFAFCEGKYWLALDEQRHIVGRIAGIINRQYNEKTGTPYARFGFMDFVDDDEVVDALFDTVETWAREKGMKVMNGPLGFLEFDASGVLVAGFDELPTAYGKYNHQYYETQLLRRGYAKDTDWVEYSIKMPDNIEEWFRRPAGLVAQRYHLHQATIDTKKQMVDYFPQCIPVLNETYHNLHGFSELTKEQVDDLIAQFVPNLNTDFVSIILNEKDEVVAFGISMPSLSRAMQKCHGKLFPFGWMHILHAIKHNDTLDLLLIGIKEEYQGKGLNAMIFDKVAPSIRKYGIRYLETTRELEENSSVQNMWNRFETRLHKRARCYIKEL
jgi:GNAT superfamily N-acetyltransferase